MGVVPGKYFKAVQRRASLTNCTEQTPSRNVSINRTNEWRMSNDDMITSQTKGHCMLSLILWVPGINTKSATLSATIHKVSTYI